MSKTVSCLVAFAILATVVQCLTIRIEPRTEQCFYETVSHAGAKIAVYFLVSAGGHLDADFKVTAPNGTVVLQGTHETEKLYNLYAHDEGNYKFCFSNEMSTLTQKTVLFEIYVGDVLDPHLAKEEQHEDRLILSLERLNFGMDQIVTLLKFHKERESSHRDLVEEMNTNVVVWSLVEVIVLVILSIFQVYYLRHFFNIKRN
ncbi:hypothetical protein AKO1_007729 [Acrasis kona]|uniref:GOLD domain-containing protein n=1 Tax=Acrasis kona TaxID=1008807 RepID=A0AAW2YRU9_9EUKA